jgi:hypothetical protein
MKYLLLLNNDARDVDSWQGMSEKESRNAREQEMPRWNELFGWIGEHVPLVSKGSVEIRPLVA